MKISLLIFSLLCVTQIALAQNHLLLSEIGTQAAGNEFVEIYNPTVASVDLSNYYLTDVNDYYVIPGTNPTVLSSDFIARFPGGFTIQPFSTLVIAINGNDFNTQFGFYAPLQISSVPSTSQNMIDVSIGSTPGITNVGECIILFYWDGASDLVQDVDMINVGAPTTANMILSKSGIAVDGPDAGSVTSTYLNDANTIPASTTVPGLNNSLKRIFPENTNEIHGGGNGITGDDETTENTIITWGNGSSPSNPGTIDFTVGVPTVHAYDTDFSIYPNPSAGSFTVSINHIQDVHLSVFDIIGKVVYDRKLISQQTIVQYPLNAGIYFVKVSDGSNEFVQKLVIQ